MPEFPNVPNVTIENSVAQIITSIALEEIGLSHIINAEGEKLQFFLGTLNNASPNPPNQPAPTFDQIIQANESVSDMLSQVSFSQMFLMGKLQVALRALQNQVTPPSAGGNILVAAGTGQDAVGGLGVNPFIVPFGRVLLQIGNAVAKTDNNEFLIMADGQYEIHYQLAADALNQDNVHQDNAVLVAELTKVGANSLVLDAVTVNPPPQDLQQRTVTVSLNAGDRIRLDVRNVGPFAPVSIHVFSQTISIMKL